MTMATNHLTHEEEQLLRTYLGYRGTFTEAYRFEDWYAEIRDGSEDGEALFKAALDQARCWLNGYQSGYERAKSELVEEAKAGLAHAHTTTPKEGECWLCELQAIGLIASLTRQTMDINPGHLAITEAAKDYIEALGLEQEIELMRKEISEREELP